MIIDSNDYRVPPDKKVDLGKWPTVVEPYSNSKKQYNELLQEHMEKLSSLQQLHYASHRYALLLIFQGMDGAGSQGASTEGYVHRQLSGGRLKSRQRPLSHEVCDCGLRFLNSGTWGDIERSEGTVRLVQG